MGLGGDLERQPIDARSREGRYETFQNLSQKTMQPRLWSTKHMHKSIPVSVVNRKPKLAFFGRFFVGFSNRKPTFICRLFGWKNKPKPKNRLGFSRSVFPHVPYPNKAFTSVWKSLCNFWIHAPHATQSAHSHSQQAAHISQQHSSTYSSTA